ncbi:MAG: COX aromatic rich motif-containing protein [bacterium]|nr:COX aromatic rich motif-containing protein [bacterium]
MNIVITKGMMAKSKKRTSGLLVGLTFLGLFAFCYLTMVLLRGKDIALLNPRGFIANEQFRLLLVSTSIMLAFAAIVLFFIYFFAWKYRESNHKVEYNSNAGRSKLLLLTAWASPMLVCAILISIMLPATQKLEPQRAIASENKELVIRVVAMQWKWLFMYPEQDIATVNYVQIPVDTPIRFELTADEAPMNSFWIPHLGGMLYAMTDHVNPLNLMADTIGDYDGGAAEINGHGFAGMRFTTRVSQKEDFDSWAEGIVQGSEVLDGVSYSSLLKPSEFNSIATYYSPTNQELFEKLLKKYAGSHGTAHSEHTETEGGH